MIHVHKICRNVCGLKCKKLVLKQDFTQQKPHFAVPHLCKKDWRLYVAQVSIHPFSTPQQHTHNDFVLHTFTHIDHDLLFAGAKSIVSIGATSISDTAKGIQRMMEMGVKTVEEMDKKEQQQQPQAAAVSAASVATTTTSSSSSGSHSSNKFPHFVFATEFTPEYHNSSWMSVHNQEDVLIRRNGHAPVGNPSSHAITCLSHAILPPPSYSINKQPVGNPSSPILTLCSLL